MVSETLSQERRILMAMRKTLAGIVRDLTPQAPNQPYPLSDATVADVKACFDLIATRERELAAAAGIARELPHFVDEPAKVAVVSIDKLKNSKPRASE